MRIGLMVGSDRERARADRLSGLLADVEAAEAAGFASFWFPQVPGYLDAMTAVALLGRVTDRIELGTAVVPIQTRHPLIMAQQALTTQLACGGRFTLGVGPSHHWIVADQLGLSYDRPAAQMRDYLDVLVASLAGPGSVDVENEHHRVHGSIDVADAADTPVLIAALGPTMLRIAGERAAGTILWMADERTIEGHIAPRLAAAARAAGRPAPRIVAGVPVALCAAGEVDGARAYASEVLGHADFSPNYVRLLEHGDARDVGDTMAAGDERGVLARLRRYRDAGVTDLAARVVPLGDDPATRSRSRRRTQEFVASLSAELLSDA
ncbi:TIGR03564 family F420-dependent LLM class oxidoreductase [Mycolicibacterium sp. S2-37]|uniref:TIGR03564 family F420-dependent LLM class oxidoreductase n=1 Tax=Mycolicibacterium sp. S2-37 TaxID=2810297 RepID=UPI001A94FCBA|nr:TIGR03564 family F420-dependent LLM class oxidoreductase [Mycolicibacterium sp. S2-37]MBO0678012.1 TIGR03564 family F420-dependent LLM class oxidoreductase [Mycolicibacterium sp. S2-37]